LFTMRRFDCRPTVDIRAGTGASGVRFAAAGKADSAGLTPERLIASDLGGDR